MRLVGFDLGTTNSLISAVKGDRAINYVDDRGLPIPSVACYEGSSKILGRAGKARLATAGLGVHGNIVRSPKSLLGRESVFLQGVERSPVDIVADVVGHVLDVAKQSPRGLGVFDAVVATIPVDMNGSRRKCMREAFRLADLEIYQFVHEPLAALYGHFRAQGLAEMQREYLGKLVLVADWGGGTLDLTLCRVTERTFVQLLSDGTEEVGGDVFDELIMQSLADTVPGKPASAGSQDPQPGARERLLDGCERAKIDLSTRESVRVFVEDYLSDGTDIDASLTRESLEALVLPLISKGTARVLRLLDSAGYAPEQVAMCLVTGGMANMPAIKGKFHEIFGARRVHTPDNAGTLIAEGSAWIAADCARLTLAKSIELVLARNTYLPLVKAGTAMPRRDEVQHSEYHLYCTDPRDGVAKFQLCMPKRIGSVSVVEPRMDLGILTVAVDATTRPFRERLELDVTVDEDLILRAHARSLLKRDEDVNEFHNLEFGLEIARAAVAPGETPSTNRSPEDVADSDPKGALCVRSNVATTQDKSLVPGEYLYSYDPGALDRRASPAQVQIDEYLYYQPCANCGRAASDPACRCS